MKNCGIECKRPVSRIPDRKFKSSNFIDNYQVGAMLPSDMHFSDSSNDLKRDFNIPWVNHPSDNARGGVAIMIKNYINITSI